MQVTLLNRGKTACPFQIDGRRLRRIRCDRFERAQFRRCLRQGAPYACVVDFLAFHPSHVQDVVQALWTDTNKALGHYIFVSTDSVYVVCAPSAHGGSMRETDARAPSTKEERQVVAGRSKYQRQYGGNKFRCEKFLARVGRERGFPYTALRLPDVIGPYDNLTGFLELRQRLLQRRPVGLRVGRKRGAGHSHRISVVFAPDVARAIRACMRAAKARGRALNICCDETPTYREFVSLVHRCLARAERKANVGDANPNPNPNPNANPNIEGAPLAKKRKNDTGARGVPASDGGKRIACGVCM